MMDSVARKTTQVCGTTPVSHDKNMTTQNDIPGDTEP